MDYSKINQTELSYKSSCGNAKVNIFTGRVLFEHLDASIGIKTYNLTISHVFNSHFSLPYDINTYMGNKWKLNIQQYVYNENGKYYYINSSGMVVEFEMLEDNIYYDNCGIGLKMYIYENYIEIKDLSENIMVFKNNKLIKTISSQNFNIEKNFIYENDKLVKVYDSRRPNYELKLKYNLDGLLNQIDVCENNKIQYQYNYYYDKNNNLAYISKTTNDATKDLVTFTYYNNNLKYAVSLEYKTGIRFDYSNTKIKQVRIGSALVGKIENGDFNVFTGIDSYIGNLLLLKDNNIEQKYYVRSCIIKLNNDLKTINKFEYFTNKTIVSNEHKIKMIYYLNEEGYSTSILESMNEDNSDLRTLKKMPGIDLLTSSSYISEGDDNNLYNEKINGYNIHKMKSNDIINLNSSDIMKLDEYRSAICPNFINYTLSFWLKIYDNFSQNSIKLNIISKDGDFKIKNNYKIIYFDDTAVNSWQEIRIPIQIENPQVCYFKLAFLENSNEKQIDISDMKLYYDTTTRVGIGYNNIPNYLDEVTAIEYYTLAETQNDSKPIYNINTIQIDKNNFLTEKDLQLTYINKFKLYGTDNSFAPFSLYYNDGTKQLIVYKVSLIIDENIKYDLDFIDDEYSFTDKYFDKSSFIPKKANFYLEMRTPDGDSYNQNLLYFTKFKLNDNNSIFTLSQVFKGNQYSEKDQNGNDVYHHKSSCEVKTTDLYGNVLFEENEYGNIIIYKYDTYGQLTEKWLINNEVSGEDTKICYRANSNDNGVTETDDIVTVSKSYNNITGNIVNYNLYGNEEDETSGYQKNYIYDEYGEKIKTVSDHKSSNYLEYNDESRISLISPKNQIDQYFYGFNFKYNILGDVIKYNYVYRQNENLVEKELINKSIDRLNGIIRTEQNVSDDKSYISFKYLDNYGDITSIVEFEKNIESNGEQYENLGSVSINKHNLRESPGCAKAETLQDSFENRTYEYDYDIMYDLKKVEVKSEYSNYNIEKSEHNRTDYTFNFINKNKILDGIKFSSIVEKDENILIEPRILSTENYLHDGCFSNRTNYFYDGYGRISTKKLHFDANIEGNRLDENRVFKKNSTLLDSIDIKLKSSCDLALGNIDYVYDEKGNIQKNNILLKNLYPNEKVLSNISYEYEYNKAFQLISEKNNIEDNNIVIKNYTYNEDGSINYITIKENDSLEYNIIYTYNNGILTNIYNEKTNEITTININNLGNIVNVGIKQYMWTRGKLLSEYRLDGNSTKFLYNGFGKKYRKILSNGTIIEYLYDKNKLISELHIDSSGEIIQFINYMYDLEEMIGFYLGWDGERFYFIKDKNRNVVGIVHEDTIVATYGYDAYGNCTILHNKEFYVDGIDIADLNPIRWKSLYYEKECELYIINQNVYSPMLRQNLTFNSLEDIFDKIDVINSLYPYQFTNTNTINLFSMSENLLTGNTIVYEAEKLSKFQICWQRFWKSKDGIKCAIGLTVLAFCLPCDKLLPALVLIGVALSLAVGATFAGFRNYSYGKGFWNGFFNYLNNEWAKEVAIEMLCFIVIGAFTDSFTQCFIAGTLILTSLGLKKIEEIKVGDKVWSYNEKTKKKELKKVKNIFRNKTKKWLHLIIKHNEKEEEIICTPNHRFYTEEKGWTEAFRLLENDELLLYNNIKCKVIKKQLQHLVNEETTYNFEVEDNHNYYVGENSVLVHNKCLKTTENVSTVDEALDKAEDFLGPSQSYYVNSQGEIEYNILVSDSDPRKVVRFDLDVTNSHVIRDGVHLNLEVYKHPFGTKGGDPIKNIHLKWEV